MIKVFKEFIKKVESLRIFYKYTDMKLLKNKNIIKISIKSLIFLKKE